MLFAGGGGSKNFKRAFVNIVILGGPRWAITYYQLNFRERKPKKESGGNGKESSRQISEK